MDRGAVRVGTSGWSYDDWEGPVYPRGLPASDRLPHYARLFPTVEVNSTFYRDPAPAAVNGWTRRAPRTEFTLKAPQDLTQDLLAGGAPDAVAARARAWKALACEPLAEQGQLGAVLLQLAPQVFPNRATLERLDAALAALAGPHLALEPRNGTWLGEDGGLHADALDLLRRHEVALVLVDGPPFPAVEADTGAQHAYVRFHGRNDDVWFRGRKVEEDASDPRMNRYHYRYSTEDLTPYVDRAERLAREKTLVRVYFNNHPEGGAVVNAREFEAMLSLRGAPVDRAAPAAQRSLDAF